MMKYHLTILLQRIKDISQECQGKWSTLEHLVQWLHIEWLW